MGQEIELKYRAENRVQLMEAFEALMALGDAEGERCISMHTRYFDTPDRRFRKEKCTLRLRQENEAQVLTFKTKGAGLCRGEWNLSCSTMCDVPEEKELADLVQLGAPELLLKSTVFQPSCQAKFQRRRVLLTTKDGAKIELAADAGQLMGPTEKLDFYELELELFEGSQAQLLAFAENVCLPEEARSKVQRAMALK